MALPFDGRLAGAAGFAAGAATGTAAGGVEGIGASVVTVTRAACAAGMVVVLVHSWCPCARMPQRHAM